MMDNYVGLIICVCMAVILVVVLYFDNRGTQNTGKDEDMDSKDEEDEAK